MKKCFHTQEVTAKNSGKAVPKPETENLLEVRVGARIPTDSVSGESQAFIESVMFESLLKAVGVCKEVVKNASM